MATRALGMLRHQSALRYLQRLAADDEDRWVRHEALRGLALLSWHPDALEEVLRRLPQLSVGHRGEIRELMEQGLGKTEHAV